MTNDEKLYQDKKLDTTVQKCPNCGGDAVFSPKHQKMKCQYCSTMFDIANDQKVSEQSIDDLITKAKVWKDTEVYQCTCCGAKAIISKQDVAMNCSFCGTNNIVKTEDLSGLKPQGVVPFKIDIEGASTLAKQWVKKRYFAPNEFRRSATAENINGVYNPAFTFDSETESSYSGRLGRTYTTTTMINGKPMTTTHTDYFNIQGQHKAKFDDIIVQASDNIPLGTINAISPFPTNNAPVFKEDFLRGYVASAYSKDGNTGWQDGQNQMKKSIENQILSKYTYDEKVSFNLKTAFLKTSYKYVLVPVYIGHHQYKQKLYNFYINGNTGKMTGKAPVSGWKVLFAILLGLIGAVGIYLLANLLGAN